MTRAERRREARRIKKLKTLPEYELASTVKPLIKEMVAAGQIPADGILDDDDIAGHAAHFDKLQELGYWRSPQLNATCEQCRKDFVLRIWLEHKPSPLKPESLDVANSEGGMVFHDPLVHVTPDGLHWSWIALCDDCSPL